MEQPNPPERLRAPTLRRSHTALPKLALPRREAPDHADHESRRSHLHHSLHRHHGHHHLHHLHHHRQHAKDAIQSAVQLHPPSSFPNTANQKSKSLGNSPSSTAIGSRRESTATAEAALDGKTVPPRPARPEDVTGERLRNRRRDEELRKSLRALSGFSLATTRRLDDTYYSILEKVASLRSAIGGLQELLDLTKQLRDEFQTDTDELEADVQGQTDGFGGFSMQRGRIEELEARIKAGREKANGLSDRLETVRQRVEVRRRVEGEWQAQSSRRFKILSGVLGGFVALLLALVILHHSQRPAAHLYARQRHTNGTVDISRLSVPHPVKDILKNMQQTASISSEQIPAPTAVTATHASRLRMLDEL